mgnify:CR=1 FL=1|tara:strand:- start:205 stop:1194 length:990 start_codon:yes stop_codon:yes gene_type:complete
MNNLSKVLVTGADGFIGSHLTEILASKGFRVRALVQYNSFGSYGWLDNSKYLEDIEVVMGDIRDPYFVQNLVKNIDIIFHLAALIAIPYSYKAAQSYIETNINGTLNLMEACRDNEVKRIIHTSTSEVYGTARFVPINEEHPLQAQSPYSASKIGADAIAFSFFKSFNLPLTIARPFNTYGPRQSSRAVIPTIISQLLSGKSNLKLGSLHPTRDFNYVSDTCEGFLELAESKNAIGETFNIGSGKEISIKELVNTISEIIGTNPKVECDDKRIRPALSEVDRLLCDNKKITKITKFKPKISLKEGLSKTVEWMKKPDNIKRYKPNIYNV